MKTKNFKLLKAAGLLLAATAISTTAQAGTIAGSVHDTSAGTAGTSKVFNTTGQICVVCHTPHNALSTAAPLWNKNVTVASYTPYASTTLDSVVGQPAGVSLMCLSGHDGVVGMDAFGGAAGTAVNQMSALAPTASFGVDLTDDHPISMTYDAALVTNDGALNAITTAVTIGEGTKTKVGTIETVMMNGGSTVECSTCHDVHNTYTTPTTVAGAPVADYKLLKVTANGSAICLTCHAK